MGTTEAREVDPFIGCSFAVGEIQLSTAELQRWADSLTVGNKVRSMTQQKLAAEQVSKIAGQVKVLADILVKISAERLNRRAVI